MLRLTLLVSAIASATFAATLAFSPAVMEFGQRVLAARTESTTVTPLAAERIACGPLAKIVDVLRDGTDCP